MIWFTVLVLASVAFADYAQPSSDDSYGVAQQQPVQVQQYPVYGEPSYNLPAYANVKGGRHHGAFFDTYIDNYSGDSDESREHRRRRHDRRPRHDYENYYPGASWPSYGQPSYGQPPLSNPFYAPEPRRHHRSYRARRHRRHASSSESEDRSD